MNRTLIVLGLMGALTACGGGNEKTLSGKPVTSTSRATPLHGSDPTRCDIQSADREVSEYDTSGDDRPDVRKVFVKSGTAPFTRLIMICREADVNGDGKKDVVRYYNDDGRPTREEADRNFDGSMDEITVYENGRIVRVELDENHNGVIDNKTFFEGGRPVRAEKDTAGRSGAADWKPDRWEYFEHGRMVRMGTDVDGDGRVDRWDRNEELRKVLDQEGEGSKAGTPAEES